MGERGGTDGYAPSPVAVGVCVGSGKAYGTHETRWTATGVRTANG